MTVWQAINLCTIHIMANDYIAVTVHMLSLHILTNHEMASSYLMHSCTHNGA